MDQAARDLLYTVIRNDLEATRAILHRHPNLLDRVDQDGHTTISRAAAYGHIEIVRLCIHLGSVALEREAEPKGGRLNVPVQMAAAYGKLQMLQLCLSYGQCDIDVVDQRGYTLLHNAARNDDIVIALMQWGSHALDMRNIEGDLPVDLVWDQGEFGYKRKGRALIALSAPADPRLLELEAHAWWVPFTEEEVMDVRYRAYFSVSLTVRLLMAIPCMPRYLPLLIKKLCGCLS